MEWDAMEVSFVSSVPGTMEESIPNDSEPSTPKSVASPAFSLISSDEPQLEDSENVLDNSQVHAVTNQQQGLLLPSQQCSDGNECSIVAGKDSTTLETDEAVRGTKIVIDNVDKNVVPRLMTSEKQTQSLHHVQMYAVEDRTDIGQLSDDPPVILI